MKSTVRLATIAAALIATGSCSYVSPIYEAIESAIIGPPVAAAVWARTGSGLLDAGFRAVAITGSNRVAAVGYQFGTDGFYYPFGDLSLFGASEWENAVLVYYDENGNATAGSLAWGAGGSWFWDVDGDGGQGAYAAGHQNGTGSFNYGILGSPSAAGSSFDANAVVVRYDESAQGLWVVAASGATGRSRFRAVAHYGTTHVYAAGSQRGTEVFTYDSVDVTGGAVSDNATLVKFDSSGNAIWGVATASGLGSEFRAIAVDADGNVYAAGYQAGTDLYDYGGATAQASGSSQNGVLVKFDPSGTALWARTVTEGDASSQFLSVAVDSLGNAYVAGLQIGTDPLTYNDVLLQGIGTSDNPILLKYNSDGQAQWGRSATAGPIAPDSYYASVAVSNAGYVYASGSQGGTDPYWYEDVQAAGAHTSFNAVLVKFDLDGNPVWATSTSEAGNTSAFISVAVAGDMLVVGGRQVGSEMFQYTSVQSQATSDQVNTLVVKYEP